MPYFWKKTWEYRKEGCEEALVEHYPSFQELSDPSVVFEPTIPLNPDNYTALEQWAKFFTENDDDENLPCLRFETLASAEFGDSVSIINARTCSASVKVIDDGETTFWIINQSGKDCAGNPYNVDASNTSKPNEMSIPNWSPRIIVTRAFDENNEEVPINSDDDPDPGINHRVIIRNGLKSETVWESGTPLPGEWVLDCGCENNCITLIDKKTGKSICLCKDGKEDQEKDMERIKQELLQQLPDIIIALLFSKYNEQLAQTVEIELKENTIKNKIIPQLVQDEEFMNSLAEKVGDLLTTDKLNQTDDHSDKFFGKFTSGLTTSKKKELSDSLEVMSKKEFNDWLAEFREEMTQKDAGNDARYETWEQTFNQKDYRFRVLLTKPKTSGEYKPISATCDFDEGVTIVQSDVRFALTNAAFSRNYVNGIINSELEGTTRIKLTWVYQQQQ